MTLFRHTRFLLLAVAVALVFAAPAISAQETTGESDPLSRYDTSLVTQLQNEYEAEGDDEALNELADARYRAIQDAPVEGTNEEEAAELREKADSLYALQSWADSEGVNIDSDLYWGEAEKTADKYRVEAEGLEAAAVVPEATVEETTEAAAPPGDGGGEQQPDEAAPEPTPEEVPAEDTGVPGGGLLLNVNLVPILAFIGLVGAAIVALSKSSGLNIRQFFSPAMAQVSTRKRPPKTSPNPSPKTTKAATTSKPEPNLEDEPEEKRTKKPRPETETLGDDELPEGATDSEAMQRWFEQPGPGEKPDEDDQDDEDDDEDPRL